MSAGFLHPEAHAHGLKVDVSFEVQNRSGGTWDRDTGFAVGWQLFDPDTELFISEGEWQQLPGALGPGGNAPLSLSIDLPPEPGRYHVYVSPRTEAEGWHYQQHWPFLLVEADVRDGAAAVTSSGVTTLAVLRRRDWSRKAAAVLTGPWLALWRNRRLIATLTKRDIAGRYRGSMGDLLWTILNPLLLMVTYYFVFGVVMQARFPGDESRSGFVLYFLAGMLPWLPFSEAVARAPGVVWEARNFVKKLVFPVEILPANPVFAAFVSEGFALVVFLALRFAARGSLPVTALALPVLIVPQLLLTMGICWLLSALGVFLRDLGQMIGFLLTLLFFLAPICYPEISLPPEAVAILSKSPIWMLVAGYRAVLIENRLPDPVSLAALWTIALAVFLLGYGFFARLRKTFADVI